MNPQRRFKSNLDVHKLQPLFSNSNQIKYLEEWAPIIVRPISEKF